MCFYLEVNVGKKQFSSIDKIQNEEYLLRILSSLHHHLVKTIQLTSILFFILKELDCNFYNFWRVYHI